MRPIFIVLALLVLATASVQGTSVVVFRRPDLIVLATDSFRTTLRGDQETHRRICKILRAGRFFFTTSGFNAATNPDIDVSALLTAAIAPAKTLIDVRDLILRKVFPHLERVLMGQRDTLSFAEMFKGTDLIGMYVFGGSNEGDPTPRVAVFAIRHDGGRPLKLRAQFLQCPGLWCPADEPIFFGASVDSSDGAPTVALMRAPRPAWVEKGNSEAARQIIEQQIRATPASVGSPISILEIRANGASWASRGLCAANLQTTSTIK